MMNTALNGKPYAGNPHVRSEVGESRIGKPRRGSLLYNTVGKREFRLALAVACVASVSAFAEPARIREVRTVPHELDVLVRTGHIQGACCSEKGIYLSHAGGLEMIGWDGRLIRRIDAPSHLGDVAFANGRVYGVLSLRDKDSRKMPGMVRVWTEDLVQLAERRFPEKLDGICVIGDTIYAGVDRWGNPPHAKCCIKRLDLDLNDKGNTDIDLGYWIQYGVQTMATDGKSLFLGNYGAAADKGNPEKFNCTRLTPDLRFVENLRFGCSEGFWAVPKSVSRRDTPAPVFMKVCAMGGNMQGWRKDPTNNPPRIRIEFHEYANGRFTDVTERVKGN